MAALLLCACDPSDWRVWIEGNREIPERFDKFVPEAARTYLIDAKMRVNTLSLRYHQGDYGELLKAFDAPLAEQGFTKFGTCPVSGKDEVGSVLYVKPGPEDAQVFNVRLNLYIKSSGHFFLEADESKRRGLSVPEGCTLTDGSRDLCDTPQGYCRFKKAE